MTCAKAAYLAWSYILIVPIGVTWLIEHFWGAGNGWAGVAAIVLIVLGMPICQALGVLYCGQKRTEND